MTHPNAKICTHCILPETFPGISFDDDGVCNYCLRERPTLLKASSKKQAYRKRLDDLIGEVKDKAPVYDVVMAYSGGKDSTYTLRLLRETFELRILALTFDNHFVSPAAVHNIERISDALQVDSMIFRPPWPTVQALFSLTARQDIFPAPTLLRASAICTACIGLVKSLTLKAALEMAIPLVAFGWSPGQAPIQSAIMKTNPDLMRRNQEAMKKALPAQITSSLASYFVPEVYYKTYKHRFPYNVHPLAFFDYDEKEIKKTVSDLGWQDPTDTDTNSTNCLLNAFGNHCHVQRHGFHPYVWEIANMVRQGVMNREEGIEKIYAEQDKKQVYYARERLGL